jgi:hypothetical protein
MSEKLKRSGPDKFHHTPDALSVDNSVCQHQPGLHQGDVQFCAVDKLWNETKYFQQFLRASARCRLEPASRISGKIEVCQ